MKLFNLFFKEKHFNEVVKGGAKVFIAKGLISLITLLTTIVMARYYGADIIGYVAIIGSTIGILSTLALLGHQTSVLRLIPEFIEKYCYGSTYQLYKKIAFIICVGTLLISLLFLSSLDILLANVFHQPELKIPFFISVIFLIVFVLQSYTLQVIRALKEIHFYIFNMIALPVLNLLILVFVTIFFYQPFNPIYTKIVATLCILLLSLLFIHYFFKTRSNLVSSHMETGSWTLLSISLPMLLASSLRVFMGHIDVLMLASYRSSEEVGLYSIAIKLSLFSTIVIQSVNTIAAPKFSELYHSHQLEKLTEIVNKSAKLIFILVSPIIVILFLFGKDIISLIFGVEFIDSNTALLILLVGFYCASIFGPNSLFLSMTGDQNILLVIISFTFLLNILLNILLIQKFGVLGAAFATSISLIFKNIFSTLYILKKHQINTSIFNFKGMFDVKNS